MDPSLEEQLRSHGAREFQIIALMADEERAMSALATALKRGVAHPVPYALTLFDDPTWQAQKERAPLRTNISVTRQCDLCGGDRFVLAGSRVPVQSGWMAERGIKPTAEPIEEYRPCPECNADADTSFWRVDGTRAK